MKKFITLLLTFISSIVSSQNLDLISKLKECHSLDEVKSISDIMVSKSTTKFNFLKIKEFESSNGEKYKYIIYSKEGIDENALKEQDIDNIDNFYVVIFNEYYKGANPDLQKKGELTYFFKSVNTQYLNICDFWIETFYPQITKEFLLEDYKTKEFRVDKDLKYKLKKNDEYWTLVKSY